MAVMMPRPAQPTPGSGPPASTQRMPLKPVYTMSSVATRFPLRSVSSTVGMNCPPRSVLVESLFGSQPTCSTFNPPSESAALIFEEVVDFPMPPLP